MVNRKTYRLTKEQLNFISSMAVLTATSPDLKKRFDSLIKELPTGEGQPPTSGPGPVSPRQTHSPRYMRDFLSLFSKDEKFKWYTHKWDQEGLSLDNLVKEQKDARQQLWNMTCGAGNAVNIRTYNQVWNFINFKPDSENVYPWVDNCGESHKIGWKDVIKPNHLHPETTIENLMLPDGHQFIDYIRRFKASIEFRTDLGMNNRFHRVIKDALKRFTNGAVNISYSEDFEKIGKDINIYCDVPGVLAALRIICDWIVKFKVNGSEVKIDLKPESDSYILRIFHEDSYFTNLKKLETPSGDLEKLRNRLFSVCDFTMVGDCVREGELMAVSVHVLDEKTAKKGKDIAPCRLEYPDRQIGGIEYIITFYK